jgi:hypothetical protein
MLTLSDLLNSAEEGRRDKANSCSVKLVEVFHTLEDKPIADEFKSLFSNKSTLMTYFVTFKFEVTSVGSKKPHKVFIQVNPDFDLKYWEGNKAQIACDCEDFKFHSVYFAKQYDSLFETDRLKVTYSTALTQPPKTATTIVCKHCIAALNYLVQNYQGIMKNI